MGFLSASHAENRVADLPLMKEYARGSHRPDSGIDRTVSDRGL
jgi:hypothetical protein